MLLGQMLGFTYVISNKHEFHETKGLDDRLQLIWPIWLLIRLSEEGKEFFFCLFLYFFVFFWIFFCIFVYFFKHS